jgi:hypothetical protein
MWMIFLLITISSHSQADFLSDLMLKEYQEEYESNDEQGEDHSLDNGETYSWDLGTPDNVPEIEIIYDQTSCFCD